MNTRQIIQGIHKKVERLEPWESTSLGEMTSTGRDEELIREVGPFHPLWRHRKTALLIACRRDCDDRLYHLPNHREPFVVVHITWAGRLEKLSKDHPTATFYKSLDDWMERCMTIDNKEYSGEELTSDGNARLSL